MPLVDRATRRGCWRRKHLGIGLIFADGGQCREQLDAAAGGGSIWGSASSSPTAGNVEKNPEAKLYRTRQTPFFNELEVICGSSISKGNDASSSRIPDTADKDANANLIDGDGTFNSFVETPEISNYPVATSDIRARLPQDTQEAENINAPQASTFSTLRGSSRKSRRQADGALLALREFAEASRRRASMREEAQDKKLNLLDDCLEELNLMKDIDNELYVKALFIFKEEYNQHIFLKTTGVRRLMWLRAVTKDINL
ncbi:hypothetical protein C4D60_Mb05t00930 [Musa balbisiana]|uniref:Uncharacterized protein n=1 Tax=Musa balbisiana TaxID=52838 RepID=A0A4S8JSU2_MUSBA|nr:hypothetical protein C4D60_Mb05t00930 [Musa balbisiana]